MTPTTTTTLARRVAHDLRRAGLREANRWSGGWVILDEDEGIPVVWKATKYFLSCSGVQRRAERDRQLQTYFATLTSLDYQVRLEGLGEILGACVVVEGRTVNTEGEG